MFQSGTAGCSPQNMHLKNPKPFFNNSRCQVVLSRCQGLFDSSDTFNTTSILSKFSGFLLNTQKSYLHAGQIILITFFFGQRECDFLRVNDYSLTGMLKYQWQIWAYLKLEHKIPNS